MGIKYLWDILGPYSERKPLYELQGKTVAVDLSCWVCEAQNLADYQVQPKMYLRNLFFRACFLLLMEVYPVFVLEGKAPELKYNTIAARNAIQFKGAKPKSETKGTKDRSRFHYVLKQCEEMLTLLGLKCLKGNGEAESLCAYLNQQGLVEGCISQDSDCFAYGAKTVYRNFSISKQGTQAASGGAVDVYNIEKVQNAIDFGRNKIVALALLCGSDYGTGIHGIGKDGSVKLFERIPDGKILERLRKWRNDNEFEKLEKIVADKNVCNRCGHKGKDKMHEKIGCTECKTQTSCNISTYKEDKLYIKNELNMRKKALESPEFPDEDLIKEFLVCKENVSEIDIKWQKPKVKKFIDFTIKHLAWEFIYAAEKIIPILTRWQLLNHSNLPPENTEILSPEKIKKTRHQKGIPSYEIIWKTDDTWFSELFSIENPVDEDGNPIIWATIEPQHLVDKAYPQLVEIYQQSKIKPKKLRKTKSDNPGDKPAKKPRKKKQIQVVPDKNTLELQIGNEKLKVKPIDNYFKLALSNCIKNTSTPIKPKLKDISTSPSDSDTSRFGDEDDSDLSDIIEDLVSNKNPNLEALQELGYEIVHESSSEEECSFFLGSNVGKVDFFEKSFNDICYTISSSSDED